MKPFVAALLTILAIPLSALTLAAPRAAASDGGGPLSEQAQRSKWQGFVQDIEDFFGFGEQVTKWSEISSWKLVGDRFATGYSGDGSLLALYDLSYPDLLSPITLGEVGDPSTGSGQALANAWVAAKKNEPSLSPDIRAAIDAMGDLPETALRQAAIPPEWWKGLPWLSGQFSQAQSEPEEFGLADLDLEKMGVSSKFISQFRELMSVVLYGVDGQSGGTPDGVGNILNSASDADVLNFVRFVREGQGHYKIQFGIPQSVAAKLASGPTRPRKLLDLQGARNGLYDNIKVQGLAYGLGELASLIPSPVVDALVSEAISRIARYFTMTETEHLEMVQELLTEAREGSYPDPVLSSLGSDDQDTLISAFFWSRATPVDFWQWLFTTPLSSWKKQQSQDSQYAEQSRQWLVDQGDGVTDLNSRFALATTSSASAPERSLDIDAAIRANGSTPPELAIDYSDPLAIAQSRLQLEIQGVEFQFATEFIPTFGFAIMAAYNYLVQNPADNEQYWEARLMQHLELRGDASSWDQELQILRDQRIDPLEISREQMDSLIAARRAMLGI